MKKTVVALTLGAVNMCGCTPKAENVAPDFVSKDKYETLSCSALTSERNDVVRQVNTLSAEQNKGAKDDAVAVAAGILVWPAFIYLAKDNDKSEQLASAKGEYDALTAQMKEKGCKGIKT